MLVSVLGDSISTHEGHSPESSLCFYTRETMKRDF